MENQLENLFTAERIKHLAMEYQEKSFNNIYLSVAERIAQFNNDELMCFIRQVDADVEEIEDSYNYPMWNTLFEFKQEPTEAMIKSAIDAGFGIIDSFDEFNTMLFVAGAGYSFIGEHWIPFYLNLPFNKSLKDVAENEKFNFFQF